MANHVDAGIETDTLIDREVTAQATTEQMLTTISGQLAELIALHKAPPLVSYTVPIDGLFNLLNAPAEGFSPEFRASLEQFAITHLKARQVEKKHDPKNSGDYKNGKTIALA